MTLTEQVRDLAGRLDALEAKHAKAIAEIGVATETASRLRNENTDLRADLEDSRLALDLLAKLNSRDRFQSSRIKDLNPKDLTPRDEWWLASA